MIYLDEEQVRPHLRMAELIPTMEKALIDFSAGKVTQPVRSVITVDPPGGFFGMMPALAEGLGLKIVTFYPPMPSAGSRRTWRQSFWSIQKRARPLPPWMAD